jgi:predicted MFS family arabinose efflux permease
MTLGMAYPPTPPSATAGVARLSRDDHRPGARAVRWRAHRPRLARRVVARVFALVARCSGRRAERSGCARRPALLPGAPLAILRLPRARAVLLSVFLEMTLFYGAFSLLGAMLKDRFDLPFTIIGALLAGFGLGASSTRRCAGCSRGRPARLRVTGVHRRGVLLVILATPVWPVVGLHVGLGFASIRCTTRCRQRPPRWRRSRARPISSLMAGAARRRGG